VYVRAGFRQDFPVVEDGRLVGVLTRNDLAAALAEYGPEALVRDVMQREFVTADPRDMLQTALARLRDCGCHTLPVVQDGRLLGLVTADNLAEVLMIQEAMRGARPPRHGPGRAGVRDRDDGLPRADTAWVGAGEGAGRN
jgi:CBS domain-containing protein